MAPAGEWMTMAQVAQLAGVARSTVGRAIARGALAARALPTGARAVRRRDAEAWMAAGPAPVGRPRLVASPAGEWMTMAQVAQLAGVARSTVSRAIARGELARGARGVWRVDAEVWARARRRVGG